MGVVFFMHKKHFAHYRPPAVDLPYLAEVQLRSFEWFFEKGLSELFEEISPIKDFSGKELFLDLIGFVLDEPKYNEQKTHELNMSYEAPLRMRARLTNKKTGEAKEQEIYLGEFPIMTHRGTFIINGIERVIVRRAVE